MLESITIVTTTGKRNINVCQNPNYSFGNINFIYTFEYCKAITNRKPPLAGGGETIKVIIKV